MKNRRMISLTIGTLLALSILMLSAFTSSYAVPPAPPAGPTLNPATIPQFVNQLVIPPVYQPTVITDPITVQVIRHEYTVTASQFTQQILPAPLPATTVWGYGGIVAGGATVSNAPGPTFEAIRGIPVRVKWVNGLGTASAPLSHLFAVDPTLHWADPTNPNVGTMRMWDQPYPVYPGIFTNAATSTTLNAQTPVPIVMHLHGAEVPSSSDGGPEQWFTPNGLRGNDYRSLTPTDVNAAIYEYPNTQLPTTLWYHDHALGITRINVMSGLAGFYLLRDPADMVAASLPSGAYEIPLAIQDRSFNIDGSLWFPTVGLDPAVHPYWQPEFFGNTIMVNGGVWPNLNVEPRQYRFRLLDGSNARFYKLSLIDKATGTFLPFTQIGGDGGYLLAPVTMTSLTIAPGERADIIVDFSALPAGTKLIMRNTAKAPFPGGAPVDAKTTGRVMQFTVTNAPAVAPTPLPATLTTMPVLTPNAAARTLTLIEVMGALGPTSILLDGQAWMSTTSELPRVGSTEDWIIVNPTADTHPIHLHLVQFEVISRQTFQVSKYMKAWTAANGMMLPLMRPTVPVAVTPYLTGKAQAPAANELGWKDTVQVPSGSVTIIRVRFAPQNAPLTTTPGTNAYPFDPTAGPGYVWHCHILDHEDNEMMRPYSVQP